MILENIKAEHRKRVHIITHEGKCSHCQRGKEDNLKVYMHKSCRKGAKEHMIFMLHKHMFMYLFLIPYTSPPKLIVKWIVTEKENVTNQTRNRNDFWGTVKRIIGTSQRLLYELSFRIIRKKFFYIGLRSLVGFLGSSSYFMLSWLVIQKKWGYHWK